MEAKDGHRTGEVLELVGFRLEGEEFGVPIRDVREIIRMQEVTRVPHAPDFVEGVINLRGQIVPIIDLRRRLGMSPKESDRDTRIVIVELDGELAGFVVDSVTEVLRVLEDQIEPPPDMVVKQDYITGVGKLEDRLLILLDLCKVLSKEEQGKRRMVEEGEASEGLEVPKAPEEELCRMDRS